jgi:hydroxyacylglutathione hydrolase
MRFITVPRTETGCLSYLIADEVTGAGLLVDPPEDPAAGLGAAHDIGAPITRVLETHTHADHISGARILAARLGVPVLLPSLSRASYPHRTYAEGDSVRVGDVELRALHTPGHTPDSMSLIQDDRALVGDSLLVGSVGRADFYPEGPEEMYHSLFDKLLKLNDRLEIHPAHYGAHHGLPDRMGTTLGNERRTNEALTQKTKEDFVRYMTEGWPPKPHGWEEIVARNLRG